MKKKTFKQLTVVVLIVAVVDSALAEVNKVSDVVRKDFQCHPRHICKRENGAGRFSNLIAFCVDVWNPLSLP